MISIRTVAALLLTVAAVTACSNDDIFADESTPVTTETPRAYTLTVKATKSGNDAGTRALTLEGNTLNATWKAGEEVAVYSVTGEGSEEMESIAPVGTLTAQSSGATAMLKGEFVSTYTPTVGTKLRLKFNDKPDYTTQEGSLDYIAAHCDYAVADITISTVDAVTGDVTSTAPASFANQQAIVKFTLKKQDGTTPVSATSLTVKVGSTTYNVTPAAAASDIFVAVRKASNKTVSLSANTATGNFSYDKTGITFENGKYYAIGVKMTRIPTLGDLYYSDGTFSTTLEEGKTPIGVIAYVGTDAFSENGVTLRDGTTTLQSHGLVLGLKNAAGGVVWRREGMLDITDMISEPLVDDTGDLKRTSNVSGYANTKFLAEKTDAAEDYPAPYKAWNYSSLPAPSSTTGWFLPSMQQWVKIFTGLGGLNDSDVVWRTWIDKNWSSIHNLETAMAKAGTKGTAYDGFPSWSYGLWSSSESTANVAGVVMVNTSGSSIGVMFSCTNKVFTEIARPVLAF